MRSLGSHASRLSRLLAPLVDVAPAWIWRPANLRQLGLLDVHFCYGHDGHRAIEINGRVDYRWQSRSRSQRRAGRAIQVTLAQAG